MTVPRTGPSNEQEGELPQGADLAPQPPQLGPGLTVLDGIGERLVAESQASKGLRKSSTEGHSPSPAPGDREGEGQG